MWRSRVGAGWHYLEALNDSMDYRTSSMRLKEYCLKAGEAALAGSALLHLAALLVCWQILRTSLRDTCLQGSELLEVSACQDPLSFGLKPNCEASLRCGLSDQTRKQVVQVAL